MTASDSRATRTGVAPAPSAVPSRRRRRGPRILLIVVVVLVVLLAVLAVVAELAARSYAEKRAADELRSSLPAGSSGGFDVSIHGFSVILQALHGSLDDVSIDSDALVVDGVPVRVSAEAADVPLQSGEKTGPVDATIRVTGADLNALPSVAKVGTLGVSSGRLTLDKTISFLGIDLSATLKGTAEPADDGSTIDFTPTAVDFDSPLPGLSEPAVLAFVKTLDLSVCAAEYLPENATVESVRTRSGEVAIGLRSPGLALSRSGLTTTGSCP